MIEHKPDLPKARWLRLMRMLAPTSPSAPTHDCMNDIKAKGITIVGSEHSFRVAREAWLVKSASRSSDYSLGFPTSGFCFGAWSQRRRSWEVARPRRSLWRIVSSCVIGPMLGHQFLRHRDEVNIGAFPRPAFLGS